MSWIEITSEQKWESLLPIEHPSFLLSWIWGEGQKACGYAVKRIVYQEDGKNLFCAQAIQRAKFLWLNYWLLPHGPVAITEVTEDQCTRAMNALKTVFSKATFLRVEPRMPWFHIDGICKLRSYNPEVTRVIDLTRTEQELSAEMHQKTRYNIRLAQKHGVTVRLATQKEIDAYIRLEHITAMRDHFQAREASYIRTLGKTLIPKGFMRLRVAEKDGLLLAATIEIWYRGEVTYLFGASSSEHREWMAPYALHADIIRQAQAEGMKRYDLWGCNPEESTDSAYKKSWEGISRFKSGWGGEIIRSTQSTWDIPTQSFLYKLVQRLRRI